MLTIDSIPHRTGPLRRSGPPTAEATAAVILLHGRGASAESMLEFERLMGMEEPIAYLAPQADGSSWYPQSFLAPLSRNQPFLAGALTRIDEVVEGAMLAGLPPEKIVLMGFSQGACLALEYAARFSRRLGAVVAFSGGLIGTAQKADSEVPDDKIFNYPGRLDGVPVFLGCSDIDAHIPLSRVHVSAEILTAMGALVDKRIYPGMGHTVNPDEIRAAQDLVSRCCGMEGNGLQ